MPSLILILTIIFIHRNLSVTQVIPSFILCFIGLIFLFLHAWLVHSSQPIFQLLLHPTPFTFHPFQLLGFIRLLRVPHYGFLTFRPYECSLRALITLGPLRL